MACTQVYYNVKIRLRAFGYQFKIFFQARSLSCLGLFFILLVSFSSRNPRIYAHAFKLPSLPGVVGESSESYLFDRTGWMLRGMRNDFLGNTDKLMTGSMKIVYQRDLQASQTVGRPGSTRPILWGMRSYALGVFWRAWTPVFKPSFDSERLEQPLGRFADWAEWQFSGLWQHERSGKNRKNSWWQTQASVGLGHIGPKGLRAYHLWIHRLTSNPLDDLSYSDQPTGWTLSAQGQTALVHRLAQWGPKSWLDGMGVVGASKSFALDSVYLGTNLVYAWSPDWKVGMEMRGHAQLASGFLDELRPFRVDISLSLLMGTYVQPSVSYVGPIQAKDSVPQWYIEALSLNLPL